jgi:tetratricopeptide (TPR) repeat protein
MNLFSYRLADCRARFIKLVRPSLICGLSVFLLAPPAMAQAQTELQAAYESGAYSRVAKLGASALAQQPGNHDLRLMVANSLAWSGRLDAAVLQYEKLYGTVLDASGKVGVANVMRWRGRANEAEPIYEAILTRDPSNKEALEGKRLTDRELRPQINKTLLFLGETGGFARFESATMYSRYTDDRSIKWGAGYALGKDRKSPQADKYASIAGYIQALNWPTAPRLDLSVADGFNKTRLYGLVSVDLIPDTAGVRLGLVNWGHLATNAQAQASGLFARRFGAYWNAAGEWGDLKTKLDAYRVSDGNFVWDGQAVYTPAWQPVAQLFTWYTGAYAKVADKTVASYWSPSSTYGLALLGVKKSWYHDRGDLTVGVQAGFKLTDEARNNLSLSANGKYWFTESTALGFDLYATSSPRPAEYKQRTLNINLLRLW